MQTFLPYPSFWESAKCLDNKRLGKQRVEAKQILECLLGISNQGWRHHPAVKMWKGFEYSLTQYGLTICDEYLKRGFKDSVFNYFLDKSNELSKIYCPLWFGNKSFHDAHKSNLLRKDPLHYSQFGWDVPNDLPYVWPTKTKKGE